MKVANDCSKVLDFLAHIQSSLPRDLMPIDYIQATKKGKYPDLETLIELIGPWPKIMEHVKKRIIKNNLAELVDNNTLCKFHDEMKIKKVLERYRDEQGVGISIARYEVWRDRRHDIPSISEIRAVFGSWENACRQVGLDTRVRYIESELEYALKRARQSLGENFTCSAYRSWAIKEGAPSPKAFLRIYGSWSNAISTVLKKRD